MERINEIKYLIDDGYLNHILISQDVFPKYCYVTYGGTGYAHILRNVVPWMRLGGISDEQIQQVDKDGKLCYKLLKFDYGDDRGSSMRAYIIRRILLIIPAVFLVTFLIFILVYLIPGTIVDMIEATGGSEGVDKEAWEKALGLDAPLPVQYGRWMGFAPQMDGSFNGLFQGSLGESWWQGVPVLELAAVRWPVTLELGLLGLIIGLLIALPIGIYSALRQDTWSDYIGRTFAILCISIPGFWLATLIIVFPAIWWDYMPPLMLIHFTDDPIGNLKMFIIPALVLGMAMAGGTMRMTRTMMLEVLRQDYIRTAWAKGLKERVVILRHAVKNALIPVVTIIGLRVPVMIGGTVIIEEIFCLPGMGRLLISAMRNRDEPLVTGLVFILAFGLMIINLMTDISYAYLDPRIRYK